MANLTIDATDLRNLADLSVDKFLWAVGETVVNEMRDSMTNTRTGPPRLRGKSTSGRMSRGMRRRGLKRRGMRDRGDRLHEPSLPGHPPAIDKGILINSLGHRKAGRLTRTLHGAAHGLYLDRDHNRPFIEPAIQKVIRHDLDGLAKRWLFK